MRETVKIEGFTSQEILDLPLEQVEALAFTGEPMVLQIGSAELLCSFRIIGKRLVVEFGHVDGGGEGVLPTLCLLIERYARQRELDEIEWICHATHCARPNLKLRRVLERRGFVIEEVAGMGEVYRKLQRTPHSHIP